MQAPMMMMMMIISHPRESHNEQENLDDVRSDGLRNTMKNMSIGDVRPREEDEDEDGPSISIRVNPSTSISND